MSECNRTVLEAAADSCAVARELCSDVGSGAFGSYIVGWQCAFGGNGAVMLLYILFLIMFVNALCKTADTFLEPQLGYVSNLLRLKPDVAGVTLLAFGNSAPDCFTGLAVATSPQDLDYSLMLSYTSGATLFIMTVVVGLIVWIGANRAPGWRLSRLPFYRDTLCFIVAMVTLLSISAGGMVYIGEALCFVFMYAFYVTLVITLRYYVQPHWPDDSFGVYLSQKAAPAMRRVAPVAQRAKIAFANKTAPLRRSIANSTFLSSARRGLLGSAGDMPACPSARPMTCVVSPLLCAGDGAMVSSMEGGGGSIGGDTGGGGSGGDNGGGGLQPPPPPQQQQQSETPQQLDPLPVTTLRPLDLPLEQQQAAAGEDGGEGIEDLDWPADSGLFVKIMWSLELPFSVMRRATIFSDAAWDERRRKWFCACPPFAAALVTIRFCGGLGGAWDAKAGSVPMILLWPLLCSPLPYVLRRFTKPDVPPRGFTWLVFGGFITCIFWMDLLASEVVALIEASGTILGVSTSVLGLTLIAWGNSAGDLIANTTVAKGEGEEGGDPKKGPKMALAACFGSPLLMNLIGTGGALTAKMATNGGKPVVASISQNCRVAYFFLAIAVVSHMVVFPRSGYAPPKKYAFYLFAIYACFMVTLFMAEAGALGSFLGGSRRA